MGSNANNKIKRISDRIDYICENNNISKRQTRCFFLCCLLFLIMGFIAVVAGIYFGYTFYNMLEDESIYHSREIQPPLLNNKTLGK